MAASAPSVRGHLWRDRLLLAAPLILVALVTRLSFAPLNDEANFHMSTIRTFGEALPQLPLAEYRSASTPLPYILMGVWGRLVGYDYWKLRLLTLALTVAAVWVFYALARRICLRRPALVVGFVVASPYLFLNAFTIYADNFALPFAALALYFYLGRDTPDRAGNFWAPLLGSLFVALAAYCRQVYLFVGLGYALHVMWTRLEVDGRRAWFSVRLWGRLALVALPVLALAPLFLYWGGLAPGRFQWNYYPRVVPQQWTFLLVFVGAYSGVALLGAARRLSRAHLLLLLMVPLYWQFRPGYYDPGGWGEGIILRASYLIEASVGALATDGLLLALAVLGAALLAVAATSAQGARRYLMLTSAAFAAFVLFNPILWERYNEPLAPVLALWLIPVLDEAPWVQRAWLVVQAAVTTGYFVSKIG